MQVESRSTGEMALAEAALRAEEKARTILERVPETRAAAEEAATKGRRAERRELIEKALDSAEDSPAARRAHRAWDEATERCWQLAQSGLDLARFECGRRHVRAPMSNRDLLQEALIGLFEAACRFEPSRGLCFSTYARWWVRAHLNVVCQHGLSAVRVPDSATRELRRLHRARRVLQALGSDLSDDAVARAAGIEPNRASQLEGLLHTESLDVCPEDSSTPRREQLPDELTPHNLASQREIITRVQELMRIALDDRDRFILDHRYGLWSGEPKTFREIGERLDLTGERVRQLHREAVRVLRERLA